MNAHNRIVVGIDGSEPAQAALRFAARRAAASGAVLEVIHTWQVPAIGELPLRDDSLDLLAGGAQATLDAAVAGLPADVKVEPRVVVGSAGAVLVDAAAHADMLVVGARGRGGLLGMVLGSTADQCLHHATVPLAIVRGDGGSEAPSRVVVGVDGSATADRALAWATDEARREGVALSIVNGWNFVAAASASAGTLWDPREFEEVSRLVLEKARADIDARGIPEVTTVSLNGDPAKVLVNHATTGDLVVVGSRGRGSIASVMLGSVSTNVAHHAPTTVVVIPAA